MQNDKHAQGDLAGAPTDQSLTICNQGNSVVQETRELNFEQGEHQVRITGIPQQYVPFSMKFLSVEGEGDATVTGMSFQPPSLTKEQILAKLAELKEENVELKFRTGGRERSMKCTVVKNLGTDVLVQTDRQSSLVCIADITEICFPTEAIESLSDTGTVVVEADGTTAGACQVRVLYQMTGASWQGLHSAIYDAKAGKLRKFESWAAVQCGGTYDKVRLTLLAVKLQARAQSEGVMFQAAAAPAGGGARKNIRTVQASNVGDKKSYPIKDLFSVDPARPSKLVPLGSSDDVPVVKEYFVPALPTWNRAQPEEENLSAVSVRLRIVNNADNNLGRDLAAGVVQLFEPDARKDAQPTSTPMLEEHVSVGETFGLLYGTAADVKFMRTMVEVNQGTEGDDPAPEDGPVMRPLAETLGGPDVGKPIARPDLVKQAPDAAEEEEERAKYRDETWEVTVHNFNTDNPITVAVFEELQGKHKFGKSSHEFKQERANRYAASVSVPAKDNATVRYTVRIWEE